MALPIVSPRGPLFIRHFMGLASILNDLVSTCLPAARLEVLGVRNPHANFVGTGYHPACIIWLKPDLSRIFKLTTLAE